MLPRASSFAALASGAVSPFQPNQRPPVSLSASKTPTASPPAAERPSWGGATRFDTTINLLFNLSNLLGASHRRAGRRTAPCRTHCTGCKGAPCQRGGAKRLISFDVFQTEGLRLVVIGKNLRITAPVNHGIERLLRGAIR